VFQGLVILHQNVELNVSFQLSSIETVIKSSEYQNLFLLTLTLIL